MDKHFAEVVASLHPSFERLIVMAPVTCGTLPRKMPESGIYLLSEGTQHFYVGRSRNIRGRLAGHSRPSSSPGVAAFAFRLARNATGNPEATYKPSGSRNDLMRDDHFRAAFIESKARIRRMDVRFVEEPIPVRQAVLEVYVAVALSTPFNDFDTY